MVLPDADIREVRQAVAQLKGDVAELETRLQQDSISLHQGSLKSIGIRILISAERIENLLSKPAEKKPTKIA